MLHRQITFISLLLLCVSNFAQQLHFNDQSRIIYRHQRQVPFQSETKKSTQIGSSSVNSPSNSNANQPVLSNQLSTNPLASSTLLVNSTECKIDIQKYCVKDTGRLISNLKALQCIDDLDNVSFFYIEKAELFSSFT